MPRRAKRPCRHRGCPKLTDTGWCEDHLQHRPPDQKPWATTTTSAAARGYGSEWRRLRAAVLRRDATCTGCWREPSTQVDHVVPKARGGTDTMMNLRGLCDRCHAAKTAGEGVAGRKRPRIS